MMIDDEKKEEADNRRKECWFTGVVLRDGRRLAGGGEVLFVGLRR